jgi:hypothetical protein
MYARSEDNYLMRVFPRARGMARLLSTVRMESRQLPLEPIARSTVTALQAHRKKISLTFGETNLKFGNIHLSDQVRESLSPASNEGSLKFRLGVRLLQFVIVDTESPNSNRLRLWRQ